MPIRRFLARFAPLALCAILAPASSAANAPTRDIPLPGDGGWDYLTADAGARRLYVTHGDRVHVLDLDRLVATGEIAPLAGAHGVALAPDLGRGFISNGKTAVITVFDLKTLAIVGQWPAGGKKPDAILYDPATKRLCSFNGETANATVFDAATGTPAGTVELGGTPEFAASDGTGQVFVNIEDRGETVRFDARTLAITARWPLAPAHTPTALAFDQAHRRLFAGCRSGSLVVLNADTGAIVAALPIGGGVDAVSFLPGKALVFVSNSDGSLNIFHQADPDHYTAVDNVHTALGARTHAVDPVTGRVLLSSARFLPAPKSVPGQRPARPAIEPGSFRVLVFQP
jgi:DNA-binding beta-propeller fold protein YncE